MIKQVSLALISAALAVALLHLTRPRQPAAIVPVPTMAAPADWIVYGDQAAKESPGRPAPATHLDRIIERFTVDNCRLDEAVAKLAAITGDNMVFSRPTINNLNALPVDHLVKLDVHSLPAGKVLQLLLDGVANSEMTLTYQVSEGVVLIAASDWIATDYVVHVYDVRDLIAESIQYSLSNDAKVGPEAAALGHLPRIPPSLASMPRGSNRGTTPLTVADFMPPLLIARNEDDAASGLSLMIQNLVDPPSWRDNGGTSASLHYWAGRFVVIQSPENQHKVAQSLARLRATMPGSKP